MPSSPSPPHSGSPRHRLRAKLGFLHPRRLKSALWSLAHRLGYFHLRLWVIAWHPRRLLATWRFAADLRRTMKRRRSEPRLTVAVDISAFWQPLTGIGWYLYRLLENLAHRDDIRLRLYGPTTVDKEGLAGPIVDIPQGPALEWVTFRVPENLSIVHYYLADQLRRFQDRFVAADGNQVLFAPNYFLPPWFDRADGQLVATIHDLAVLKVPETMQDATRQQLSERLESTLARTAQVLTDTETVRQELIDAGLVEPQGVHAVHLGPGSVASVKPSPELPEGCPTDYVLHVGTLEPRKNLSLLFDLWKRWLASGESPPPLVLCGGLGWKAESLTENLEQGRREGWLHHLGYLDDAEVAALYAGARWVTMPSLYEGFGLPLVEAMAHGRPLLCSDIPVLREVAADAALYAALDDPDGWLSQVRRLHGDATLREDLGRRSAARFSAFDWRHTAQQTVDVWRAAATCTPANSPRLLNL